MKFNITADAHAAQVDLNMDGKGGFTGVISHTEFGDGQITDGVQAGDELKGNVVLDGHTAKFEATLSGSNISGRVSLNWLMGQDFTGVLA